MFHMYLTEKYQTSGTLRRHDQIHVVRFGSTMVAQYSNSPTFKQYNYFKDEHVLFFSEFVKSVYYMYQNNEEYREEHIFESCNVWLATIDTEKQSDQGITLCHLSKSMLFFYFFFNDE